MRQAECGAVEQPKSVTELAKTGSGNYKHGFQVQTESAASSHYHGYPNEWHGPKRKYDNSRRAKMGNHGGGIPQGSKAKAGTKGTSKNSADTRQNHAGAQSNKFKVGDHVVVRAGFRTGIKGKVKRTLGLNHVHVVPQKGRAFIANVKHLGTARIGRFYGGIG